MERTRETGSDRSPRSLQIKLLKYFYRCYYVDNDQLSSYLDTPDVHFPAFWGRVIGPLLTALKILPWGDPYAPTGRFHNGLEKSAQDDS